MASNAEQMANMVVAPNPERVDSLTIVVSMHGRKIRPLPALVATPEFSRTIAATSPGRRVPAAVPFVSVPVSADQVNVPLLMYVVFPISLVPVLISAAIGAASAVSTAAATVFAFVVPGMVPDALNQMSFWYCFSTDW
jgi:hypothetical protein